MGSSSLRSSVRVLKVLLVAGPLSAGSAVRAQTTATSSAVHEILVTSRALPNDPGRSLTAVVVELAPSAKAASHHHAGIVFASVLEGAVRSQLNDGAVSEYRAGQYSIEPPDAKHTLTSNTSRSTPARLLAVFIAPTGAQLTTYDK